MPRWRQLSLPGLNRRIPSRPRWQAKRDFSAAEFARALERNGFRPTDGGLHFLDLETGRRLEAICRGEPWRLARRATLAKLLRERAMGIFDPSRRRTCSSCIYWVLAQVETAPAGYRVAPCGLSGGPQAGSSRRGSDRCESWMEGFSPLEQEDET